MNTPLFGLDSADYEAIKERTDRHIPGFYFPVSHVTTNPSLLRKAGKKGWDDYKILVYNLLQLSLKYVSVETCGYSSNRLEHSRRYLEEAQEISNWNDGTERILVKIPASAEGLNAIRILPKHIRSRTNATLVFNIYQALRAADLGVFCISPFLGRLDDYYKDDNAGIRFLEDIMNVWERYNITETKVLAASIRNLNHVEAALRLGVHMLTLPLSVYDSIIRIMENDPCLLEGLEKFRKDWFME